MTVVNLNLVRALLREIEAHEGNTVLVVKPVLRSALTHLATMLATQDGMDSRKLELVKALTVQFCCLTIVDILKNVTEAAPEDMTVEAVMAAAINTINGIGAEAERITFQGGHA